ncbi:MAG TPA: hypothetical protein VKB77_03645 [Terriglobales bacterium]|nr:hypothetical protein [Terriglobales bacterium]
MSSRKAIPCGLTIRVTMFVNPPVDKSSFATEVGAAEYAANGAKIFLVAS